jgi:acetylornithine deacetylase/succinyl-diaminopimelate desuccinylase-like protein
MDKKVLDYLNANKETFIKDLQELVRFPTVANERTEMEDTVTWLEHYLNNMGIKPIIDRDANFPVFLFEVEGESPITVLVYGHYDVTPVYGQSWDYPPFGAEIVNGRMYGRGTVDDKGQIMAPMEAVRAFIESGKKPPVTVRFLLEGEEEIGSPSLQPVLVKYHDFLNCNALINYDDSVWFDGRPRVVCGLKGGARIKLTVRTNREYHGLMYAFMPGAIWRLVWALNSIMDKNGKVLVKDLADDIVPPTQMEIAAAEYMDFDASYLIKEAGIKEFTGGKSSVEVIKSFNFDSVLGLGGIKGGYVLPEKKGVVPSYATAEISVTLVPNQIAERVGEKFKKHLDEQGFEDVEVEVTHSTNIWARTPIDSPIAKAMGKSLKDAFKADVVFEPSFAGSGPEGVFQQLFPNMEQAYSGFGPAESRIHGPNEYIEVEDYIKGIESIVRLFYEYKELKS